MDFLLYSINFERNYDVLKSENPSIFWNKKKTLIKTKRNRKWNISHTILEKLTLSLSSYKNRKLKVKLRCVEVCKIIKTSFLHRLFCPMGIFLTFLFQLPVQCIECTFRIYIFLHIKKHYVIHFCCLFLKSSKAFSVSLKVYIDMNAELRKQVK